MELSVPMKSYEDLLDEQKNLFEYQIEKLQDVVATQCKLTGVNPLSQEMAAGALSIKIGKRPRDLLNPKAVKYMQSVFSIKDAINKRETREMSAQFGLTATQVRDFFAGQRSRVRKFSRLSREKATTSSVSDGLRGDVASTPEPITPVEPLPLNTIAPTDIVEEPSCPKKQEDFSGMGESDLHFIGNIFRLMRKEESFSGQVKLLKWIIRMENPSVLSWFLAEGGLMILATWLSEAAKEEQSSFIRLVLKLLEILPMIKALPVHMSAVLQSVNRLRFYRTSDISHRARVLLAKWSNIFGKKLSLKKNNGSISASDLEDDMLLKQSIDEVMGDESWDLKDDNVKEALRFLGDNPDNHRMFEVAQPLKMLTAPGDESNKRRGVLSSHTRERRKVQMVEHPSQRLAARNAQVARPTSTIQSRPLSADDIQKAKIRAQFMQSKHGKTVTSSSPDEKLTSVSQNRCVSSHADPLQSVSTSHIKTEIEERKLDNEKPPEAPPEMKEPPLNQTELEDEMKIDNTVSKLEKPPDASVEMKEPRWKSFKRIQIPWRKPSEVEIKEEWSVSNGANSKEIEVQKNRIRREREIVYNSTQEIPSNPKEPWDSEMDPDDTLTPEIPIEQLPEVEPLETPSVSHNNQIPSSSSEDFAEPDLHLLAELLKNPQLVFALTSGQAGNLSHDATVKLLDMIKLNGASRIEVSLPSPTPSTEPAPNGTRPDLSRNPFSQSSNGSIYHTGGGFPATAVLAPQSSVVVQQPQAPQNEQMYHQSRFSTSHTQNLTTEMMVNANTMPNSDWAGPRAMQGFGPDHHYQHSQNLNGYSAYAGGHVQAVVPPNSYRGRLEYDSWSPGVSPSRHQDYLPGPDRGEINRNSRNAYMDERTMQQQNIGGPWNKRWRDDGR